MTTPAFFVPGVPEDEAEERYTELAQFAGRAAPATGERVYRIEWVHDGERWTAEVGKEMHGVELPKPRRKQRSWARKVSDPANVLAIFPGSPWIVVTDARPLGPTVSSWVNPFMAGQPAAVEYFATPGPDHGLRP